MIAEKDKNIVIHKFEGEKGCAVLIKLFFMKPSLGLQEQFYLLHLLLKI